MSGGSAPDGSWRSLLSAAQPDDGQKIQQLTEYFRTVERSRFDLGTLAGPRRRDEPGYRWLPYKEAFSPDLVRAVLDEWPDINGLLLDMFAGSATSLLVAAERGLDSLGVELLPYAQWAADAVVRSPKADRGIFWSAVSAAADEAGRRSGRGHAEWRVPAATWAVSGEVGGTIKALRAALPPRGSGVESDLAHLALVSVVERVSTSVKDGTSLRHRDRRRNGRTTRPGRKGQTFEAAEVVEAFLAAAEVIAEDMAKMPSGTNARVLLGDARSLPVLSSVASGAIFSPPYPNRYDYSAIYQLELEAAGFVEAGDDLRRIRKSLLRSHLEAPPPASLQLEDPRVLAVLRTVASAAEGGPSERGRTLRMLVGYFDDMCRVFAELARVLRPGAPAACVVATQTFFGCPVPTDLMLASIAERSGLVVEEIWVLRHKRVAVQQQARGNLTSTGGRESVLMMRRS